MGAAATALQKSETAGTVTPPENEIAAKGKNQSRRPSIPRCDIRTASETQTEYRLEGHWEVWEMEWGGARWVRDRGHSRR